MKRATHVQQTDQGALFGPPEVQKAARAIAETSAANQGVPPRVADRAVIERVARLARHPDSD